MTLMIALRTKMLSATTKKSYYEPLTSGYKEEWSCWLFGNKKKSDKKEYSCQLFWNKKKDKKYKW